MSEVRSVNDPDYKICTKTVMDNIADPTIRFDENGVCNYYYEFLEKLEYRLPKLETRDAELQAIVEKIKSEGAGKKYDCIIGVSGGVDSSYVAYLVKKMGLRPLAVHLDNGWNSELAVKNVENILKILNIDLYTVVVDWEIFSDWQLSFLKASTPDAEVPTDHIIAATMYDIAHKFGVRYILSGMNFRSEGLLPPTWARGYLDWRYLKGVQKKFGTKDISSMPHLSISKFFYYNVIKKMRIVNLLNYMDFIKKDAMVVLERELEYRPYSGKHYESIYTRFFQSYILPTKFGIDKRKPHNTCLILGTKELTREQALAIVAAPTAPAELIAEDTEYMLKKFGISAGDFDAIMKLPIKTIFDYPNNHKWELKFRTVLNKLRKRGLAPK
ncbi:MAG: N-acetyl sugar amidotransferase [Chitinophagaceae bacterium]